MAAPKVMSSSLIYWSTVSGVYVGGMTLQVESS